MRCWRLVDERYSGSAFSGEGAALWGGRWNQPGTPVVYISDSQALAVLEVLVHLDLDEFPATLVMLPVDIPDDVTIDRVTVELMIDWEKDASVVELAEHGTAWAARGQTVALSVPSVVIPAERNLILNPRHGDFARLVIGPPEPFVLDPRLTRRATSRADDTPPVP